MLKLIIDITVCDSVERDGAGVDIKRCEAFVAAVDNGSMSGAAKQLGYTPSGIIRLINALEGELGFPVVARRSTGVELTPEGARMLPLFREMMRIDDQAHQTSARIRGLAEGELTIGSLSTLSSYWLPAVLREYRRRFPNVKVNVVGGSNAQQRELLDQSRIDCCLCHGPLEHYEWIGLGRQQIMVWARRGTALTRHSEVLLVELDGVPFVMTNPDDDSLFQDLMYAKGIEPDIRFTTSGWRTTYSMVEAGLGVSLCADGIAEELAGGVVALPLSPQRYLEFGIALPPVTSPAVEEFVTIAQQFKGRWPVHPA